MRTDGIFNLASYHVRCKSGQTFHLIPFGDVHRDSPAFADDKWNEFLEYAKSVPNALFLGMGDYLDSYSTSERRIVYNPDLHESTREREERETMERIEALAGELEFMKGRVVGILGGNHYPVFSDGTTGDQVLAKILKAEYLGVCAAIRIHFFGGKSCNPSLDLFAHHGKGGGVTACGKFNAVERLDKVCEADIFLMGDNHARGAIPLGDKLRLENNSGGLRIRARQAFIGRTGSFLRGYVPGRASYVVDGAMSPANLGWIEFLLTPRRSCAGGNDRCTVEIKVVQ